MLLAHVFPLTGTQYQIRFYSNGLNVSSVGVQGYLLSSSLINNLNKKNILLTSYYLHAAPAAYFSGPIYSYAGITITTSNVFFGLNYFWSFAQNYNIQFNVSNLKVLLFKEPTVYYLSVHILVFLRNHCPTPYTYDETLQTCVMCMTNCDECDGT